MSQDEAEAGAATTIVVVPRPEAGLRVGPAGVSSMAGDTDVRPFAAAIAPDAVTCRPAFGRSQDRLHALARTVVPDIDLEIPGLSLFYEVTTSDPTHVEELLESLRDSDVVDGAYVRPPPLPATVVVNDQGPLLVEPPPGGGGDAMYVTPAQPSPMTSVASRTNACAAQSESPGVV